MTLATSKNPQGHSKSALQDFYTEPKNGIRQDVSNLSPANKAALDEAIMDQGITDYEGLTKALRMAHTFMCEATSRLTFEQFQGVRQALTMDRFWCEEQGLETSSAEVLMYPEGSFILITSPGPFHLIIGYNEWRSNNLESLEQILYDRWYC